MRFKLLSKRFLFPSGVKFSFLREAAKIILKATKADAISITDKEQVLAHAGAASDHHQPGQNMATLLTKKVIENGKILILKVNRGNQCYRENCPLQAAIVVPLQVRDETVGSLKLYFENGINWIRWNRSWQKA